MFNANRLTAVLAVSLGSLALTASASAAQRVVSPTGTGTQCIPAAPCDLRHAVEVSGAGDEVIVTPGNYTLTSRLDTSSAAAGLDIHGVAGEPRPRISTSGEFGLVSWAPRTHISDLEINHTGRIGALLLFGGVTERVFVKTTADSACNPFGEGADAAVLRDSVCLNTGTGWAVSVTGGGTALTTITPKLRNVTAVTNSPGEPAIHVNAGNNTQIIVDARNVIAQAAGTDVFAGDNGVGGARSIVTLRTSNFANVAVSGGASSVSSPSSNGNQSAAPAFVDGTTGDFRQAAGSPTIDAGSVDSSVGTLDLDRQQRVQNGNVDIGADETAPPPPAPPVDPPGGGEGSGPTADTDPPDVTILSGPARRSISRRARLEFSADEAGATFECAIDNGPIRVCGSPQRYRRLANGRHRFWVWGTDAAGNTDLSPATLRWRVRR